MTVAARPALWIDVFGVDRNLAVLPESLIPPGGCPRCGSAWLEVRAVKVPRDELVNVTQALSVRLRCTDGHVVEYDGRDFASAYRKCRISWCHSAVDSADGWCWQHLVCAFVDRVPMPEQDRERVQGALREAEGTCRRGSW